MQTVWSDCWLVTMSRTLSLIIVSHGSGTETIDAKVRIYCSRSFWKRSMVFWRRQQRDSKPLNSSRNLSPFPSLSVKRSRVNCKSRSAWRHLASMSWACACNDSICCCKRCFSAQAVVRVAISSDSQLCSVSHVVVNLVRTRWSSATISAALAITSSGVRFFESHTSMPKHRHKRRMTSCNWFLIWKHTKRNKWGRIFCQEVLE